ncbi:MAG: undecaprenyl-diphosphate phosphatase [Pseudomonadota bacterium]
MDASDITLAQLILLAVIQGLTEFLPISSSAHLILIPSLLNLPDQGTIIDVAVHVGSLFAVILYFRAEVLGLLRGLVDIVLRQRSPEARLALFLIAATIPTVIAGAILYLTGAVDYLRDPDASKVIIAVTTIGFGLLLWASDRQGPLIHRMEYVTFRQMMIIGLCQTLALIPGTSRAGITITAARYLGFVRTDAARISMLLSLPTISAFGLLGAVEIASDAVPVDWGQAAIAVALSFVSAYVSIFFFMKVLERMSLTPFVIYRLMLGVVLLALAFA